VFAVLAWAIHASTALLPKLPPLTDAGVHAIGTALMHNYVLPLEIVGLLLTAALIGAVLIAMHEKEEQR
ncbi:MAG TPA: NADH-quinone oxidoreductase subunit J, partial [Acidobacteriaceae bacterium]|nr:NADH-quinone oxidoreductase subunit J [Acidobacteriaceae bacterium]